MAAIGFYHLTRTTAEQALPRLLGRTLDLGERALVLVRGADRVAAIDEALWQVLTPVWLPHGTVQAAHAALQPILIAQEGGAVNKARFLFLLDGVQAASLDPFARVFDLFDGGDAAAMEAARGRWTQCKEQGHTLAYWRQEARGWVEATRGAAAG
ncbi:DNA polymerase III subunit chi [Lichenicoccus sp.]|uniref:DNA polymerase III subunit chi n=1 Tax=Lichenicoccus sp. TaxID=2781899 RepID=UPI003D0E3391